ncbi:MAG: hypothetical protein IJ083_16775 [Clostridia bacterium]|nr:hypothetical protein [Clostridia bacterium]
MKRASEFCTCTDYACPCHPLNHDQGCSLCIQKNLREKEIPTCFFRDIMDRCSVEKPTKAWHYEDFAGLVLRALGERKM